MTMTDARRWSCLLLIAALAVACGKKKSEGPAPEPAAPAQAAEPATPATPATAEPAAPRAATVEHRIDALGVRVEVPADWETKEMGGGSAWQATARSPERVGGTLNLPGAAILKMPMPAPAPGELAQRCLGNPDGKVLDESTREDGAFWVLCEQTLMGNTVKQIEMIIPLGDAEHLTCKGNDMGSAVDRIQAICASISRL